MKVFHLFSSPVHDYKLPEAVPIRGKLMRVTYKADRVDIEKEIRHNPELYRIVTKGISAEEWLDGIMREAVGSNSFCLFQFKGPSNSGKSWAMIQIARLLQMLWILLKGIEGRIIFAHFWGDTLEKLDEYEATVADNLLCDEESKQSGQHSVTDANSLDNVLGACRAKAISFSFADPEPRPKVNIMAMFRVVGIIKEAWITWLFVYSPAGNPVGNLFLKIDGEYELLGYDKDGYEIRSYLNPEWAELMKRYEPAKMENIDRMIASRGMVGSDLEPLKMKVARELYRRVCEKGHRPTVRRLRNYLSKMGYGKLPSELREQIVSECQDIIKEKGLRFMSTSADQRGVRWRLDEVATRPLDVPEVWKEIRPHLDAEMTKYNDDRRAKGRTTGYILKCYIDWLEEWILHDAAQTEIAHKFDISQTKISRETRRVRNTILGYAVEDWIAERYPNWEHKGGNTDEPDFISKTHVISVKGRCRANPQFGIKMFGKKERIIAFDTKKVLQMWYFEFKFNPRLVIINATPITEDVDSD